MSLSEMSQNVKRCGELLNMEWRNLVPGDLTHNEIRDVGWYPRSMDWCSARYIILVMCGQHGLTGRDDDDLLC